MAKIKQHMSEGSSMIRRLRLKFVVVNMTIVLVMLIVIFGLVYFFTQNNLEQKSIDMMRAVSEMPVIQGALPDAPEEEVRLPYFMLQVGLKGELTATGGGYYDLTNTEFLNDLSKRVLEDQKQFGVIDEYNLRFLKTEGKFNPGIVFADISSEQATLNNLVKSCVLIGIAVFLCFLAFSILLSKWVVKPVDTAFNMQRQFVADASHELKTPLTVIMTNAELIQSPQNDAAALENYAGNIVTMSERMRSLINQLLELAKVDNVNKKIRFRDINLSKAVNEAVMPFEPIFFEQGLSFDFNIEENIIVRGDLEKLEQIVGIFLDNARKYSKENARVELKLNRNRKGHCLISVSNEGDFIPEAELKNIFKRFYRIDKARNDGSSFGLGLSMAETITRLHKGKIWAESSDGVNTFYVELICPAHCNSK